MAIDLTIEDGVATVTINRPERKNAILLAMARRGLFLIPLLLILPRHWGIDGLIFCQPLADVAAITLSFLVVRLFFKHLPEKDGINS